MPSRTQFLLYDSGDKRLDFVDSGTLESVVQCAVGKGRNLIAVSEDSILIRGPDQSGYDYGIEIYEKCGPLRTRYDIGRQGDPFPIALLGGTRAVALSSERIALQEAGKEQWGHRINKKRGEGIGNYVSSDERGTVFAVSWGRTVGGSDILDTNGRLVDSKVIVFRASDGSRLMEVSLKPVESPPAVQEFRISRDGKYLGILDEGDLRLIPIPEMPK